jgi:hypothetical protein
MWSLQKGADEHMRFEKREDGRILTARPSANTDERTKEDVVSFMVMNLEILNLRPEGM